MNDGWPGSLLPTISEHLSVAQRVLVVAHIRPDGDAIGSVIGLGLALKETGKDVQMVLPDGVPANFRHLVGSEQVRTRSEGSFDFVIVLDCSDLERTGNALNGRTPDLNIDHHVTNLNFARINLVDTNAVATAEILAKLLTDLELPMPPTVLEALLTGIITDTIGFRTSNMTSKALRVAADLMERGAKLSELYQRALGERSFEAVRFWGAGLNLLEREGRLVWTTLTLADRKSAGYSGRDDADLINIISSIEGADIAIIFVEQPNGRVKVSWRAKAGFDVSRVALDFGGGGHPAASGAELWGNLEEVRLNVLQLTRLLLDKEETF